MWLPGFPVPSLRLQPPSFKLWAFKRLATLRAIVCCNGIAVGFSGTLKLQALLYIVSMAKSASGSKTRRKKRALVRLLSSRTVYRGPVFWVTTDHIQEPGGVRVRRDLVRHTGSIVVLAVDDSRAVPRVLLERLAVGHRRVIPESAFTQNIPGQPQ